MSTNGKETTIDTAWYYMAVSPTREPGGLTGGRLLILLAIISLQLLSFYSFSVQFHFTRVKGRVEAQETKVTTALVTSTPISP